MQYFSNFCTCTNKCSIALIPCIVVLFELNSSKTSFNCFFVSGYLQSLMNKIANNVNIIVNNLIVKFVEDDIVLSLNVKSAEIYSASKNWERDFIELTAPDFVLRRCINFIDLTVCLDKRDASGKIETYQDPVVYRCSIASRLYSKYESMHAKYPMETKLNVYCERVDISLTDTQLPMLIRLIELAMALYYGTFQFKQLPEQEEPGQQNVLRESQSGKSCGDFLLSHYYADKILF